MSSHGGATSKVETHFIQKKKKGCQVKLEQSGWGDGGGECPLHFAKSCQDQFVLAEENGNLYHSHQITDITSHFK